MHMGRCGGLWGEDSPVSTVSCIHGVQECIPHSYGGWQYWKKAVLGNTSILGKSQWQEF